MVMTMPVRAGRRVRIIQPVHLPVHLPLDAGDVRA
jgi:hypothetical protein